MKYAVVVKARNEEANIEKTLLSLKRQTLEPSQLIVVDDGSTDQTGAIGSKYADLVVRLRDRGYSATGRPELAKAINEGLARVEKDVDYVMICDSDHVLPVDYVETIIERMEKNPHLVVASGRIKDEPYEESWPRGSGRLVKVWFWKKFNNMQYPVVWCWEEWLCYKALQQGYEVRAFKDVISEVRRHTGKRSAEAWGWGKSMYALGYDWKFALARCLVTFLNSPRQGVSMFRGWLHHNDVEQVDIASWVNRMQKKQFHNRVLKFIRYGGRK